MSNFFTDTIKGHASYSSKSCLNERALLEPIMRQAVQAIIEDAKAMGISLLVYETFRSKNRQRALFKQGSTQLEKVGVHHYGLACDLVKDVGGQPSWKGDFTFLGKLARTHGLIWGGDWGRPGVKPSFFDGVHVQRVRLSRQKKLFAGDWYPDATYDPWA